MCFDGRKNPDSRQKKPEGTSSAIFGVEIAAKCCEIRRCADRVRSPRVLEGKFLNLYFSPSTKRQLRILLNFFFLFLDISHFFSVLNFTSVELNRFAKQAKLLKNIFFKSDGGHAISRQEKRQSPKSTVQFPAKKR